MCWVYTIVFPKLDVTKCRKNILRETALVQFSCVNSVCIISVNLLESLASEPSESNYAINFQIFETKYKNLPLMNLIANFLALLK